MYCTLTVPYKTRSQDISSIQHKFRECLKKISDMHTSKNTNDIIRIEHAKKRLKSFFVIARITKTSSADVAHKERILNALFSTCRDVAIGFSPEGESYAKIEVVIVHEDAEILKKYEMINPDVEADKFSKKQRSCYMFI